MNTRILVALAALSLTACSTSDNHPDAAVGMAAINEASYRGHVATLASDEFGGRAPASPGEELTVDYLVQAFKSMGLSPGNGSSYTQEVPLTSVEVTNRPSLTISGARGKDLVLEYGKDQVLSTRQQLAGTELAASDLVFVGYGINAPEREWNDYAGIDVTGKTVVMLINDPGYATQNPELFNGNAMTYYGRWDYKYDEAARQGAAGAIIIHDTKPASYPWSTVENSWSGAKFDLVRADKGINLSAAEGWIALDSAKALFSRAGLDLGEMYQRAKTPGFKAQPLGLTASATLTTKSQQTISNNVAALLPGSEATDEAFIYMAHWDHIGTDPTIEGDGIFNGALDNATGTAGLLELAKAFSTLPQRPRRSILFVAVTAEEQGLLGSLFYASNPLHPLAKTVAGLNMDWLNNAGKTRDVTVVGYGFSDLDSSLGAAASRQNRVLGADRTPEHGYYFRSDHFELARVGVPMLYPNAGYDLLVGGVEAGLAHHKDFIANHYHGPSDEYSPDWDVSGAIEDLQLYFMTGEAIANSSSWPNWKKGSEFKAARDAQRPGAQ